MSALWDAALRWWRGGDLLMPVMLTVAVALYAILAERSLALWGGRRRRRAHTLADLLADGADGDRDGRWRTWAARQAALADTEELERGFAVARALTACLPLLGLLGTVTGMVDTFAKLGTATGGAALARQASGGIGLALTATQYGMALAIPAVLWDWLLSRRAARLAHHRELVARAAHERGDGRPA